MRSKLWETKVSLHVLSACSGFSLIFLWTRFFFYNQSPSYVDKWRLFENLWGKNIKKEKRLLTCLKNCFTVQQPPLPPPSSFRASEYIAWLCYSRFSSPLPCWGRHLVQSQVAAEVTQEGQRLGSLLSGDGSCTEAWLGLLCWSFPQHLSCLS